VHIKTVEKKLLERYAAASVEHLVTKLKTMAESLYYSTDKKSIILFASLTEERVCYLNIEVQQQVIVGTRFGMKQLASSKKESTQYLFLVLGSTTSRLFLGDGKSLKLMVRNDKSHMANYKNRCAQRQEDALNKELQEDLQQKNFIQYVDNSLSILRRAYPLPLILASTKKAARYFNTISKNTDHLVQHIPGNFEAVAERHLIDILHSSITSWEELTKKHLLLQIEAARTNGKCAVGINDVALSAKQKKGKLLIMERSFSLPVPAKKNELHVIGKCTTHVKDGTDLVIENVLLGGGDVELVDDGLLKEYNGAALIEF
jgi:hypothetical protein